MHSYFTGRPILVISALPTTPCPFPSHPPSWLTLRRVAPTGLQCASPLLYYILLITLPLSLKTITQIRPNQFKRASEILIKAGVRALRSCLGGGQSERGTLALAIFIVIVTYPLIYITGVKTIMVI